MTIAVSPNTTYGFITDADKKLPECHQTEYTLRPMTQQEQIELYSMDAEGGEAVISRVDFCLPRAFVGVPEARPLRDASGTIIPFESGELGGASDAFIDRIPFIVKVSIASAIVIGAVINPETVKKSEPVPVG